jgi:hypothetical protein
LASFSGTNSSNPGLFAIPFDFSLYLISYLLVYLCCSPEAKRSSYRGKPSPATRWHEPAEHHTTVIYQDTHIN